MMSKYDVVIIGAGPSGAIAAGKLNLDGYSVLVLEKMTFPRFVIGESLLPQCMDYLEKVDLLEVVAKQNFQLKNGARFFHDTATCDFNFNEKFTDGWDFTYQVKRAEFDQVLINEVSKRGVEVEFKATVTGFETINKSQKITFTNGDGMEVSVEARFVIDASGYGRVLPKLLNLSKPSNSKPRGAIFSHFTDQNKPDGASDNIYIHAFNNNTAWVWSIPFSDHTASVGVVGDVDFIEKCAKKKGAHFLEIVSTFPILKDRYKSAELLMPPMTAMNYSIGVKQLYGDGFVLCGNATEFLDPIFSSGVTLAIVSGYKAAELTSLHLKGESVDWDTEYSKFLLSGIDVFRSYVQAWYNGNLQNIFFAPEINQEYKKQICSVLAGYVWDDNNPFVTKHKTILPTLAKVIDLQNHRS